MNVKIESAEANQIKIALQKAIEIIDKLTVKNCSTCEHWLGAGGCKMAEGRMPPEHVQKQGCPYYENDGMPF